MKKILGYTTLAIATAPAWLPLAFLGYVGYKSARYAFAKPKTTLAIIAATGLLWYATSTKGKELRASAQQTVVKIVQASQKQTVHDLEERLRESQEEVALLKNVQSTASHNTVYSAKYPAKYPTNTTVGFTENSKNTKTPTVEAITDKRFNFYYVKMDDTLGSISRKITGSKKASFVIAKDNAIRKPDTLMVGQLLKIRKNICVQRTSGLYTRIPKLHSTVVPGGVRISDYFGNYARACDALAVSRELGLEYQDFYPRTRVVYYW